MYRKWQKLIYACDFSEKTKEVFQCDGWDIFDCFGFFPYPKVWKLTK